MSFQDPGRGLDSLLVAGARRFDSSISREALATSLAALELLLEADLDAVLARARGLAHRFAAALSDGGHTVAPRGDSTLVSFEHPEPAAARERLAAAGIALRDLPGRPYLRASVGAWNDESDLERLLEAL
jgi:L-cysteine/cystine lyase